MVTPRFILPEPLRHVSLVETHPWFVFCQEHLMRLTNKMKPDFNLLVITIMKWYIQINQLSLLYINYVHLSLLHTVQFYCLDWMQTGELLLVIDGYMWTTSGRDWQVVWCAFCLSADSVLVFCCEKRDEPKGNAFCLPVKYTDQNETVNTSMWNESLPLGKWTIWDNVRRSSIERLRLELLLRFESC